MLFSDKIEPKCAYCCHGSELYRDRIACIKSGVVSESYSCRRFRYDPLKRIPPKPASLNAEKFKSEDFSLT